MPKGTKRCRGQELGVHSAADPNISTRMRKATRTQNSASPAYNCQWQIHDGPGQWHHLSPLEGLRKTYVHLHKKVRVRRIHGKSFACVCSAKNLNINVFWWEAQEDRHPIFTHGL